MTEQIESSLHPSESGVIRHSLMSVEGKLSRRKAGRIAPFVYTGVQLISPRLLDDAPEGPFSTNILWDRAIAAGRLYGLSHMGQWFDVGTPANIAPTEAALTDG